MTLLQAWLTEINEYAQEDVVIMLLGNKSDMASDRIIKPEDGEKLAKVGCWTETCELKGLVI